MKNSFVVKCIAVVLFAAFMTTLLLSGAGIVFGIDSGAFVESAKEQVENRNAYLRGFLYKYEHGISEGYQTYVQYGKDNGDPFYAYTPYYSDNILYEIKDEKGEVVYSSIDESAGDFKVSTKIGFYVLKKEYRNNDDEIEETYEEVETGVPIEETTTFVSNEVEKLTDLSMVIYAPFNEYARPNEKREYYDDKSYEITVSYKAESIQKDFIYYVGSFYDFVAKYETDLCALTAVSAVLSLLFFIILLRVAGHTNKSEDIFISKFDKFPVDILTVIYGGLTVLLCLAGFALYDAMDNSWYYNEYFYEWVPLLIVLCFVGVFIDFILLGILLMTFSVRFKTSTFIRSSIIYKTIVMIIKMLKFLWNLLRKIPVVWKTAIVAIVIIFIEFLLLVADVYLYAPFVLIINCILCVGAIFVAILLKEIKNGTEDIANGNVYNKINTKYLFLDLKDHAENINNMSDGIQKAVAEQMKSERFKTELITNVSHDIKTPLTSIINYVDLLEKEEIQNETAKEYIDVLSRQSSRLKKLIDDLVEASKASTGNIKVNLMKFEMGILLSQALGEYEERFEKNNLQVILNKNDEMLLVMADNRHMWRVFDNILNNIAKYAQSGTRVYIDTKRNGKLAEISFRNISKDPLNISGDELMERFVRGDSSRNTEGSGLGLSIAKSLTEVQKGNLNIQIDGDLFKVQLSFPLSE